MNRQMINAVMTLAAALASAIPATAQGVTVAAQAAQERAAAAADMAAQGAALAAKIDTTAITRAADIAAQAAWMSKIDTASIERAADALASLGTTFTYQGRERDTAQRAADDAMREKERAQREKEREGSYYEQGQNALDSGRWDRAVTSFDRVVELKGTRADAALYWKAYAQNKQGLRPEALATLGVLSKEYPKSRYLSDAKALEVEVKNNSGQSVNPASESDEEMKLIAIQTLANNPSEEAIPILQKVLQGTGSPRLKARALFVLAQTNSPKARDVLVNVAKGGSNPDLQMKAVQYLGVHGGRENRAALADIYTSSTDIDLKKRILNAFMVAVDKDRVLAAATSEQNGDLRASAVQQLGVMGASEELWSLYQKESTVEVKKQIIRAMFVGGNATRLGEIARSDSNGELRLYAVRNLGVMGGKRTGDTLVEIYAGDKDPDVKRAVINGLFVGGNAEQLVALARKEQDSTLKKDIVSKLSNMHSKVATDYLLEILNK